MLHHRPLNTIQFMQDCLDEVKDKPPGFLRWNSFIEWKPSEAAMKPPPPSREGSARKLLRSSQSPRPPSRLTPVQKLPTGGSDLTASGTSLTSASPSTGSQHLLDTNRAHSNEAARVQVASSASVRQSPAAVQSFP